MRDDLDPEQVAREALAEIQEALKGLYVIRELLTSPKPKYGTVCPGPAGPLHGVQEEVQGAAQKCVPRRDHRR